MEKAQKLVLQRINPKLRQTIWVKRKKAHKVSSFFGMDITKNDFKKSVKKPLKSLEQFRGKRELDPDLMIFHIGRCGSTLISEVLKLDRQNFVLSEPEPPGNWHKMKNGRYGQRHEMELFRGVLRSFSAARFQYETRTIFKFSTYNNFFLKKYLKAFPDCPRIFLHRHPNDVLMSYLKGAPPFVQGFYGYFSQEKRPTIQVGYLWYLVHHLRSLYESVEAQIDSKTLILNYNQLDLQGFENIFKYLKYDWTPEFEAEVRGRMRYYSKPRKGEKKEFNGDQVPEELKVLLASEDKFIRENLMPFYDRFEKRRKRELPW